LTYRPIGAAIRLNIEPIEFWETALTSPESVSRVRGRVFALHASQGVGHARLPDNRRVAISFKDLRQDSAPPNLGDMVEFVLDSGANGLEAKSILVIRPKENLTVASPQEALFPELERAIEADLPQKLSSPSIDVAEKSIVAQANELYQLAAVARTEGRFVDARTLFDQAIEKHPWVPFYTAFAKMEMDRDNTASATEILERGLKAFPTDETLHVMHGQMERRQGNIRKSEEIFRKGLSYHPRSSLLRQGLARALAEIGTATSIKEASRLLEELEKEGNVNKHDQAFQRFSALRQSPRAARALAFFDRISGLRVGIPGKRDLPPHTTDLIVDARGPEWEASFGLSKGYLVRCFDRSPTKEDINALLKVLRTQAPTVGLMEGREVAVNSALAFVVVPGAGVVRDQFMSVLSENNEALVPLDDGDLTAGPKNAQNVLSQLLAQFLGARDLYLSTLPVSGRRFYGRERLLVQVTDQVHRGEFIGVFGLRKMGKTSLVYQLRDEKLSKDAVAYIDLQASDALITRSFGPIHWEIERELLRRTAQRWPHLGRLLRLARYPKYSDIAHGDNRTALIFAEDMRELLAAIAGGKAKGPQRIVIILDELERILPINTQPPVAGYLEFFALLRGLAQTGGAISSVVVAANSLISEKASWEGRENPVFALYQPIFLPPFSDKDTFNMVRELGKGMSVYWDDDALDAVYFEMGGHPFLTRQLCSRIIQANHLRPLRIDAEMVNAAVSSFIREETDKFAQIMELLHTYFPEEEKVLEQCAQGKVIGEATDQGLKHLAGYRLLDTDGPTPRVTPNALRRWILRRSGVPA
jgi:tetratricopeptide (TPR) repeat protein